MMIKGYSRFTKEVNELEVSDYVLTDMKLALSQLKRDGLTPSAFAVHELLALHLMRELDSIELIWGLPVFVDPQITEPFRVLVQP